MTETSEGDAVLIASLDDLLALDLAAILSPVRNGNARDVETTLREASERAQSSGDEPRSRALRLLYLLSTLHLNLNNPADAWGPRWQAENRRSFTASDFRGHQNDALAQYIDRIAHPILKARVADVVWHNDRSRSHAAAAAVEAYSAAAQGRLDGTISPDFEDNPRGLLNASEWLQRACQIHSLTRKNTPLPEIFRQSLCRTYTGARDSGEHVVFVQTANLGTDTGLLDWRDIARDAEQLAGGGEVDTPPAARKDVWLLAAKAHGKAGDPDRRRYCELRAIGETLRMRDQVDSAMARADWTRRAIGECRALGGLQDVVAILTRELDQLAKASQDEFRSFSTEIDISEEARGTIQLLDSLTLPDVLLELARLAQAPTLEDLRGAVEQFRRRVPLAAIMPVTYHDSEGRVVAEFAGANLDGSSDPERFKADCLIHLDTHRNFVVAAAIEPARHSIMTRFPLAERHFRPIVEMSPFVPPGHEQIFALGFQHFWQGDRVSAAYLLIPMLESLLRHLLKLANQDTSKLSPGLLQEDRSLSAMLGARRTELEAILGPDLVNEIDLLFNFRAGPSLRHEVAHGKLTGPGCHEPSTIYACWLIYRLTCLPLVRHWEAQVAPAIEAML